MYCKSCGSILDNDAKFCTNCGSRLESDYPQGSYTNDVYNNKANESVNRGDSSLNAYASKGLRLGIFGLIFCWVPILNIILAASGIKNSKRGRRSEYPGRAITGLVFSIGDLVTSIVMIIYIPIIIILAVMGM